MKVAIVISGSIRKPELSLATLKLFADDDVSVFIHTWRESHWLQLDSFSRQANVEPTSELIEQYRPAKAECDKWLYHRKFFIEDLERWKEARADLPRDLNNIGFHGMYWSLLRASAIPVANADRYDLLVRLRFDCQMSRKPSRSNPGWVIPEGNDFFGLNDQLGWFWTYPEDGMRSICEAQAYFGCYSSLESSILAGVPHGPESLLKANFDRLNVPVRRELFDYSLGR